MSDIIQLLPDYVANQIAAGEVVQRPASIVKELLENAVDAEASQVELIVREAGKNLVQVVDNGVGMSETDARMAFERHATSKIRSTEDIFRIASKGFRGEALASIAAVAQVELKTKKKDAPTGTNIYIEGGEIQFQEPIQTAEGSSFAVKNVFYNVPARRKFLKNNNVEFRHIIDEFQRVALAHPNIGFDLFHNDEIIFKLRKGSSFLQRIVEVFGRKLQPLLVPVKEELDWIHLHGYVAKPEGARKTRGEQFFFVNGRFFKSAYLNKAVQEAFDGLLMSGYHPSFFLFLELAPEKIDVNIHPQKTEVKFEDESLIFALIRSTIKRALGIYNITPSLDFDRNPQIDTLLDTGISQSSINDVPRSKIPSISVDRDFNPFEEEMIYKPSSEAIINLTEIYDEVVSVPSKINLFEEEDFNEDLMRLPNGYWLLNQGEKTLMLHLGRMHRVIMEEHYKPKTKISEGQQLLFSLEYHLNEIEKNKYRSIKKYLPQLGYHMTLAQDNVLRIDAIPFGLKEEQVIQFLEKVFEILDYRTEDEFLNFYQEQWTKLNSKSRFDFISKIEVEALLKDYTRIGFPSYTANGKKCFIELPLDNLQNQF